MRIERPPPLPSPSPALRRVQVTACGASSHRAGSHTPPPPSPFVQVTALCMWRIILREMDTRSFFFALKSIAAELHHCERVLSLLLPPTLVTSSALYL